MLADLTPEELDAGLDGVVAEVLAEVGIDGPPIDAFALARRLGITIATDDGQSGRARYVRLCDRWSRQRRPTILLRTEPRLERQQWAIAHEIGEHAAWRVFRRLGVDPRTAAANVREWVANQMAGRILLPTAWFAADGVACDWDLIALKARYATASHELIARRMLEGRPAIIMTVFDQQRLSWRRSNVLGRAPALSAAELTCWREVQQRQRSAQQWVGSHAIRGWPVYEKGWAREILRTEVAEEACDPAWDS